MLDKERILKEELLKEEKKFIKKNIIKNTIKNIKEKMYNFLNKILKINFNKLLVLLLNYLINKGFYSKRFMMKLEKIELNNSINIFMNYNHLIED